MDTLQHSTAQAQGRTAAIRRAIEQLIDDDIVVDDCRRALERAERARDAGARRLKALTAVADRHPPSVLERQDG
jgi:hypothetical protein